METDMAAHTAFDTIFIVSTPNRRTRIFRNESNAWRYARHFIHSAFSLRETTAAQYQWERANRGRLHVKIAGYGQSAHKTLAAAQRKVQAVMGACLANGATCPQVTMNWL
jgi:hypothetical protein